LSRPLPRPGEAALRDGLWKGGLRLTIKGTTDPPDFEVALEYAGEDSLRAFLTLLRPLYLHDEPSGFEQMRLMTRRHADAKGTPDSQKVIAANGLPRQALRQVLTESDSMVILEQTNQGDRTVRPGEVFEDFLHGRYFHLDDSKAERLRLLWTEIFKVLCVRLRRPLVLS
jgi:hypothetical protein